MLSLRSKRNVLNKKENRRHLRFNSYNLCNKLSAQCIPWCFGGDIHAVKDGYRRSSFNLCPKAHIQTNQERAMEEAKERLMRTDYPLLNKRIALTSPRQYAQKLASKLIAVGARPVWIPTIAITNLTEDLLPELDESLSSLDRFSHIAFTSKNGITAVVDHLAQKLGGLDNAINFLNSSGLRIGALGADGDVLEDLGIKVHIRPKEASTQGLVKELVELGEAKGARVLCPVPEVTGGLVEPPIVPRFIEALTAAGAFPTRVPAYLTTLGATPEDVAEEAGLLARGGVAAIVFTSSAEAQGLVHLLGGLDSLRSCISSKNISLAAHGPYTAAGVSSVLGLPVPVVSRAFSSFDGVVTELEAAFRSSSDQ